LDFDERENLLQQIYRGVVSPRKVVADIYPEAASEFKIKKNETKKYYSRISYYYNFYICIYFYTIFNNEKEK
jgi:polyferredoxin